MGTERREIEPVRNSHGVEKKKNKHKHRRTSTETLGKRRSSSYVDCIFEERMKKNWKKREKKMKQK
jgi:hypothetical protein